jgi:hypothetical protein
MFYFLNIAVSWPALRSPARMAIVAILIVRLRQENRDRAANPKPWRPSIHHHQLRSGSMTIMAFAVTVRSGRTTAKGCAPMDLERGQPPVCFAISTFGHSSC